MPLLPALLRLGSSPSRRRLLDKGFGDAALAGDFGQAELWLAKGARPRRPKHGERDLLGEAIDALGHGSEPALWLARRLPADFRCGGALARAVRAGGAQSPLAEMLTARLSLRERSREPGRLAEALRRAHALDAAAAEGLWRRCLRQEPGFAVEFARQCAGAGHARLLEISLEEAGAGRHAAPAKRAAFKAFCEWRYLHGSPCMLPAGLAQTLLRACPAELLRLGRVAAHRNPALSEAIQARLGSGPFFPSPAEHGAAIAAHFLHHAFGMFHGSGIMPLELPMLGEAPLPARLAACSCMIEGARIQREVRHGLAIAIDHALAEVPFAMAEPLARRAQAGGLPLPRWGARAQAAEIASALQCAPRARSRKARL